LAARAVTQGPEWLSGTSKLPEFAVYLPVPDLTPWIAGNDGIPGVWRIDAQSGQAGAKVVLVSLMHGNEIAGAIVLDRLLRNGIMPLRGSLTLVFANLDAFARFDPGNPTASRFAEEDMNRLWDEASLDGSRQSLELTRARALRPILDQADIVLDLHSMLWPSEPLILCGPTMKGRALAVAAGTPPLVVADHGHVAGRRLIDYGKFVLPEAAQTAILVEAGQHWETATVQTMLDTVLGLLAATGLASPRPPRARSRCAEVTQVVTANSGSFAFAQAFQGGDIVHRRHTLIATDGGMEIRTPHDECLLVMPSLRPSRGHTAVRLARFVDCYAPD
jgi:predicted deacylase